MSDLKVGIIENGTYKKTCKPEHFMRKYHGFGISQSILDELKKRGIERIEITYIGKKGIVIYHASVKEFDESSKTWMNEGTDLQKFLSINEFRLGKWSMIRND